jgi:hypothetical protein
MGIVASRLASVALLSLALGSTGCIKKILTDGQISSTRQASDAFNTFSDWDVAYRAASAGLAQFEGMHNLAPYNEDAMFLLTRGWSGLGFGFIEDEMEQAEDLHGEDSELATYHRARAIAAYARAIHYGTMLLETLHEGFEAARRNNDTMELWLSEFEDPEEAPYLLWTGQAWLSKVNLQKDNPEIVADLFVGYLMIKRSVELDPAYSYASGHAILGAYHARSGMAELDESKKHFEEALRLTEGKALLVKFNYATKYYCAKVDKDSYVKLLREVVKAGDTLPEQRLPNTIAKRRARRYLTKQRMDDCGFPG